MMGQINAPAPGVEVWLSSLIIKACLGSPQAPWLH